MSGWRSKISKKKFDNKQISKTNFKSDGTDNRSNLSVPKQRDTITSANTSIPAEDNHTTIQGHQSYDWQLLKSGKRTSTAKDTNSPTSRQLPKFFRFGSLLTKKEEQEQQQQQTSSEVILEQPTEWEQILDREFQSLDIDADGYVSIADLQSVLKNFSHICNSNEIMLRIFDELDRNHDQRISKQEFKLYKNILLDRQKRFNRSTFEEKLSSIFALFDRNQDNYISRHEIRETMRNLGEHIDDNLIEEMMQSADADHDGRISRDEFQKLLIQLHSRK